MTWASLSKQEHDGSCQVEGRHHVLASNSAESASPCVQVMKIMGVGAFSFSARAIYVSSSSAKEVRPAKRCKFKRLGRFYLVQNSASPVGPRSVVGPNCAEPAKLPP